MWAPGDRFQDLHLPEKTQTSGRPHGGGGGAQLRAAEHGPWNLGGSRSASSISAENSDDSHGTALLSARGSFLQPQARVFTEKGGTLCGDTTQARASELRWPPRGQAQGAAKGRPWQPLARGVRVRKLVAQQVRKYLWSSRRPRRRPAPAARRVSLPERQSRPRGETRR